jgi:hypothetical protein
MTFKLERNSDGERWTVRLIGFVQPEHLEEVSRQLNFCGSGTTLDLEGVTVVGVEVIRFLLERERHGTELLRCPAYIREWISREGEQSR